MTGVRSVVPEGSSARRRLAALALLTATLTATAGAALGGSGWHVFTAATFLVFALTALFSPTAINLMVVVGQALAASLLLAPDGPGPMMLLPIVSGVIVSAELFGVAARQARSFARDPGDDLRQVGFTALLGGGVFSLVVFLLGVLDRIPVPIGLPAVALAVGACVVMAGVFARAAR